MNAISVASRVKDRRLTFRVVCTCGFKSKAHVSADTAVWVLDGHRVQCKEA